MSSMTLGCRSLRIDLSNFFRNGGTLQLLHADIAGNTAGADEGAGYGGATTGAVAPGAVIISEIMWGLDAGIVSIRSIHRASQYDLSADIGD